MCRLSYSLSLYFLSVCTHMCVCLKIHQACSGFLQRAAAVGSNQPPLPMSEHPNPFVYLSTCYVCVRVYVSMLIQGRALPNTPWKHSIHQQLEAEALGPALHFHWERGRQRRGGEKGGEEEDVRLPQGREEGHSSECLCLCHEGHEDWAEYIYKSQNGWISSSDCPRAKCWSPHVLQ